MGLFATLSINDSQHSSIECRDAEFRYAECHHFLNIMLSVVMLNAVMPSVVAPFEILKRLEKGEKEKKIEKKFKEGRNQ